MDKGKRGEACAGVSDGLTFGQQLISKVILKFQCRRQFPIGLLDFLRFGLALVQNDN